MAMQHPTTWHKQALALLRRYVGPHWAGALLLGAFIVGGTGLELLGPQVLQRAIDATTAGANAEALGRLGLLYILVVLVARAVRGASAVVAADLGWRATNRLRCDLSHQVLSLPMQWHAEVSPGQLSERVDGDPAALGDFFSRLFPVLLGNAVLLLGAFGILFAKDWRIGLTFLVLLSSTVLVYRFLGSVAVPAARATRQAQTELMGVMEESLRGAEDARSLGARPHLLNRFHQAARAEVVADRRSGAFTAVPMVVVIVIMAINEAANLVLGVRLVGSGVFTIGTIYLILQYADMMRQPLQSLGWQLGALQTAAASVGRVSELLGRAPEDAHTKSPSHSVPAGPLGVRLSGVTLAYAAGSDVLSELTLRLGPGQSLGVVGRTGSGKSSLARLLVRLYEPTAGSIALYHGAEECDLAHVVPGELRRHVCMVTQDVQLFAANVRDNLTLFGAVGNVSDTRLRWAVEQAGLGEWLGGLPEGLDTTLKSGASGLSAGQAQLLALARVFLRDPGLVLLDEPTSQVDPVSESLLALAVDRLLAGRTAIVIAHRLSTLQRVDRVLVLQDGVVSEQGDRATLASDPSSRFYSLLHAQPGGRDAAQELGA